MSVRSKRGKAQADIRPEAPPTPKRRKTVLLLKCDDECQTKIHSLPAELVEEILSWLSARDVVCFGATCRTFHLLTQNVFLWRKQFQRQVAGRHLLEDATDRASINWKRFSIFKCTQALYMHRLSGGGGGRLVPHWGRVMGSQLQVSSAVVPSQALGFCRCVPTRNHLLLWDHQGTLYLLRNAVTTTSGKLTWRRAARYTVLCRNAKDFTVDPRNDPSHRSYVYVLVNRVDTGSVHPVTVARPSGPPSSVEPAATGQQCNCVEIYQQDNGLRVFRMTFHFSLTFTQICLTGSEFNRTLLLLTDTGKVYALYVNESNLSTPQSYTVQMALKKISRSFPNMSVKELHTGHNSAVYLTAEGSAYMEVHASGVYRQFFGTHAGFDPHDIHVPLPLSIPNKVVKCSMSQTHLCLVDDCGYLYMQGCNRHGQLGTGDKIDRREPSKVALSMALVDVWCGLNHTLALLQGQSGIREVHGTGCGAGGRLPGCPDGSAVFIKLSVKVPRSARSLCASKDCLYVLCSHDILEPLLVCPPPAQVQAGEVQEAHKERERLQADLSRMQGCSSMQAQLDLLRDSIQCHMTLSPAHRDFLDQALNSIRHASSCSSATTVASMEN